jgi:hypothetical protein
MIFFYAAHGGAVNSTHCSRKVKCNISIALSVDRALIA